MIRSLVWAISLSSFTRTYYLPLQQSIYLFLTILRRREGGEGGRGGGSPFYTYLRDGSGARARGLKPADRARCLAVCLDELPPLRPIEGLHVLGGPNAFDLARGADGGRGGANASLGGSARAVYG